MFKKILTIVIAVLLIQAVSVHTAFASSKEEKQAQRAEKIRAGIVKLGVGPQARVTIKLRGDAKLAGYVSEVKDDSFVVTEVNTKGTTAVA